MIVASSRRGIGWITGIVLLAVPLGAAGEDWPQFRGPNRDNISRETGLLKSWPAGGPKLLWALRGVGKGFSSVAVVDGVFYTSGNQVEDESVYAIDAKTQEKLWTARNGTAFHQGRGDGPRGTPTVDGNWVYVLGGNGDLSCFDRKSGSVRWHKNILKEYQAENIKWGISESVLIDGDRLICTPGGDAASIVALDKATGAEIWKTALPSKDRAGYASAIAVDVGEVRQYVQFTRRGTVGVRASDGTLLWQDTHSANGTANCSSPVFWNSHAFTASGYGTGGALLKLSAADGGTSATLVYKTNDMKNHHGGMVVVNGYLYGANDPRFLACLELSTGKVAWQESAPGKGSLTYADGHLYYRDQEGPMVLIEATPTAYVEKGRFDQPQRSDLRTWAHPVVADGKLYLRDMDVLLCYDLRSE